MFFFRYWLFSDLVPGLYIEKGWVHESIEYSFTPPTDDKPAEVNTGEEMDVGSDTAHNSQGTEPYELPYVGIESQSGPVW